MPSDNAPFYVTTPIYYVTAAPSIGNAYTTVAADMIARWHRQRQDPTWFLTGTDEHGQKVLEAAQDAGKSPREFTDEIVAAEWQPMLEVVDADNDDFIRTTDDRHITRVREFWQTLYDNGHVYEGTYEGPYCIACEEFKQPGELLDGDEEGVKLCPIHERPVEQLSEQNYFFRLSDFADKLLALYDANPAFVQPDSARNEVIAFVRRGLDDLSVTRSSFDWGIKVPWDESHVLYVWIEALLNYITAIGYGEDDETFTKWWPAVHLVGKDIMRFHAVIWPAMLMAAGVDVPRQVFAHGWLQVGGQKMSKSKATAIHPSEIVDTFGSDAYRYYFLKAIAFGSDGSFSWEHMSAVYTAELANGLGNLASRVTAMVGRYFDGVLPEPKAGLAEDVLASELMRASTAADAAMDRLATHEALAHIDQFVQRVNGYVTEQEPWKVAKDDSDEARERLATILYTAAEALRALAVLHAPTMPQTAAALWESLGAAEQVGGLAEQDIRDAGRWGVLLPGAELKKGDALFPRLAESEQ